MISFQNIHASPHTQSLFEDLSFSVPQGERIALLGPNGAGKSTLLNLIGGSLLPRQGIITLDGVNVTHTPSQERAALVRRLFQNPSHGCIASLTVAENFALAAASSGTPTLRRATELVPHEFIDDISDLLSLDIHTLLGKRMGDLSGGQRQLLSFLMALVNKPPILLLDEPTAALDPEATQLFGDLVLRVGKQHNTTMIFVSHDHNLANRISTQQWILKNGKITQ